MDGANMNAQIHLIFLKNGLVLKPFEDLIVFPCIGSQHHTVLNFALVIFFLDFQENL